MEEIQQQIIKEHKERQEKFVYYIIALTVSCIGFAIYNTLDAKLQFIQIPLGIAVLSWGISVYCGIKFLKTVLALLYDNIRYYDVKNGNDRDIGSNPEKIKIAVSVIKPILLDRANKVSIFFNWQVRLFYSGIIFFIVWRIIVMYNT